MSVPPSLRNGGDENLFAQSKSNLSEPTAAQVAPKRRDVSMPNSLASAGAIVRVRTRTLPRRLLVALFAAACIGAPALAHAQVAAGIVRDPIGRPVAFATVVLERPDGTIDARGITGSNGGFAIKASRSGRASVRALRLGYKPSDRTSVELVAGQTTSVDLILAVIAASLDTVTVVGSAKCERMDQRSARSLIELWSHARSALASSDAVARDGAMRATYVSQTRLLTPTTRRERSRVTDVVEGTVSTPWSAASPATLRRLGYVQTSGDSTIYNAPGADMLASDEFLLDHCFGLSTTSESTTVGVRFSPTPDRRNRDDIKGTIWLDRTTRQVDSMAFTFDSPELARAGVVAGGEIRFGAMTDSAVAVVAWSLRVPQFTTREVRVGERNSKVRQLESLHEQSVRLTSLGRDNAVLWTARPLSVRGVVRDSATRRPVPLARVHLEGSTREVLTDHDGQFLLPGVRLGWNGLLVGTPSLDSLGSVHRVRVMTSDTTSIELLTPSARAVREFLCGRRPQAEAATVSGILVGSVQALAGVEPTASVILIDWDDPVSGRSRSRGVSVDSSGSFVVCDLPIDRELTVYANSVRASSSRESVRLELGALIARRSLALDSTLAPKAALNGQVLTDSTLLPIGGVEISIPSLGRSTRSSPNGFFTLKDLPPGSHTVVVRAIGYSPIEQSVQLSPITRTERRVLLGKVSVLERIETIAERPAPWQREFDDNRRIGLGRFFDREALAKFDGRPLYQMLEGTTGLQFDRFLRILSKRNRCFANIYLDEFALYSGKPNEVPPSLTKFAAQEFEAIEWYPSPASTPARYSSLNATCGVLVMHTRRPQ